MPPNWPGTLGVEARAENDRQALVEQSQLVVTATPSRAPLVSAGWLHPRLHITAMGADQHGKNEIDPLALARADAYVCDRLSQCEAMGELRAAICAGAWTGAAPRELGEVIAGTAPGRTARDQVTICDLTGTGAQDTAIATHALAAVSAARLGTVIRA